jgi:ubiquinone/menaquinone biosynthesis C-methylase UbiE
MTEATEHMRLGRVEFLAMNNWLRRLIQRHLEMPLFMRMLSKRQIDLCGRVIMDAGCGSGYSTSLILERLAPARLIAFDFMPEQIELARRRSLGIDFKVGDLRHIEAADSCCDAVFIFGVLHHISVWQEALTQVARVLKPGGVLLVEEPFARFTPREFETGLESAGLVILERRWVLPSYFRAYLCRKAPG